MNAGEGHEDEGRGAADGQEAQRSAPRAGETEGLRSGAAASPGPVSSLQRLAFLGGSAHDAGLLARLASG